jgi:hypothetical protein
MAGQKAHRRSASPLPDNSFRTEGRKSLCEDIGYVCFFKIRPCGDNLLIVRKGKGR